MADRLSHDLASLRIDRSKVGNDSRGSGALRYVRYVIGGLAVVAVAGGLYVLKPQLNGLRLPSSGVEVETTEVSLVSPSTSGVDLTASGYVVPQVTVKVSSRFTARIEKVAVSEGSVVHVGDELFVLDASSSKSSVQSADAKVATARARVQTARASAAEVRQQLARQKQLLASGAVSPASVEDLAARVRVLDAQVGAADAELKATIAERKTTEVDLKDMAIRSSINGRAVSRPLAVGELATPEKTLVELMDFESLVVEVDVAEGRLEQVKSGTPCEIILDAYPSKRMRGEVVAVNPKINRAKATGTVKVRFLEHSELALPEMAARVSFLKEALDSAEMEKPPKKVVPSSAVVERGGEKVAFTIEQGRAHRVPLKLGPAFGGGYELLEGPPPGTRLIRAPSGALEEGQRVKLKDAP